MTDGGGANILHNVRRRLCMASYLAILSLVYVHICFIFIAHTEGTPCNSWISCIRSSDTVQRGVRQDGLPFYTIPVSNYARCLRLCEYLTACESLNYCNQNGLCYLFNLNYTSSTFSNKTGYTHTRFTAALQKYPTVRQCPQTGCPNSMCIAPENGGSACRRTVPIPCNLTLGYVYYKTQRESVCIKIHATPKKSWSNASQTCHDEQASLYRLKNQDHFQLLYDLMIMYGNGIFICWINGQASNGTFTEMEGNDVIFFPTPPPDATSGMALVAVKTPSHVSSATAHSPLCFICEANHT